MFCANCGQPVPADARFCPSCAAPVSAPPERPALEERKLATVLFADLVGSTALAGSQDPERTRARMNRFYDAMSEEIEDAGGTVEKFVGDAVMAAFGAPAAQEDHAERALHAALSMQRRLGELFGDALALRIGVNTGVVVVGQQREGSSFVSGDAVNVAARLEQAAAAGEILVGDRTAAAAGAAFEFESPGTIAAKGKPDGVPCRRLVRALSLMRPRGIGGLNRAFVGRESELEVLRSGYRSVVDSGEPCSVTVVGEVGVGKTTLIREFWEWLATAPADPLRRVGRCAPYGHAITYAAIGEIVREHLGLLESDTPTTVQSRLGEHETLGVTLGLEPPADLHPLAARDRLHQAWVSFLDELVSEHPTVVLIEDVHWADDALLDLLGSGLEQVQGPLLLLATARPEFTRASVSRGRSRAETIWLEPLSSSDSGRLVDELVPTELPESLRDAVIERAEGNPFFVEEVLRTLIDQSVLRRQNGSWVADGSPGELVIPDNVQAVLAARIDLLDPAEKAALQAAAVIGRTFWSGPVYELLDGLEPDLRLLEERDFIRRRQGSSIAGEREFVIKHALTRQVAYDSLPKARRARLHARFASWLEREGEGRDEHAALLAHHYAEAVRPEDADLVWGDDEPEAAHLRDSAVSWLRRASDLAVARYEIEEALALLGRALALEPPRTEQLELWERVAQANALYFDGEGFSTAIERAIDLAETREQTADLTAERAFQTMARSGMWRVIPDSQLVDGWIEGALEVAGEDSAPRAKALIARCYHDHPKSRDLAQEASAIAERLGDARLRSYGFDVRGLVAFAAGDYEEALEWQRRRVGLVADLDDPDHQADIYANAIPPAVALCEFDEARRYTNDQLEVTRSLSPHHRLHGISAAMELEELLGNWGRIRELQAEVEAAVADNADTPCVRNERSLLVCALANAYEGEEEESRRLEELATAQSMRGYGTVIGAPRQQLALQRGDVAEVAAHLGDPSVRRTAWFFLSSVATHFDALAALGEGERVEVEAKRHLEPGSYLEPFALRALGLVRKDAGLIERAATAFDALGLSRHAARTRTAL